jgi:hypothetical protein
LGFSSAVLDGGLGYINVMCGGNLINCHLLCFVFFELCFCIISFMYVYVSLLVLSVLPPSDNSIAVSNNINKISAMFRIVNVCCYRYKHLYTGWRRAD